MKTVDAELLEVRSMMGKSFTAKVYVPFEGYASMEKLYYNGNTKTQAKQKAKDALMVKGFKIKFV